MSDGSADIVLINGRIYTGNPPPVWSEAIALGNGRIRAVGREADMEALKSESTEVIDLEGRVVLPGFNDAHTHVWKIGSLLKYTVDVRGVHSLDELSARIQAQREKRPTDKWVRARGYNEATLKEGRHPTRADLDAISPDKPMLLIRTCAHIGVANSAALKAARIDKSTPNPPGGRIDKNDSGEPTGILHETAVGLVTMVMPSTTQHEYEQMILAAQERFIKLGVTSVTDAVVTPSVIDAYRRMDDEDELKIRFNLLCARRPDGGTEDFPLPTRYVSDHLRIDSVKFFADGGLSGATAALNEPYKHADTRGVLRFEQEEFENLAAEAYHAGYRVATHAIGDAAIEMVLTAYEKMVTEGPGLNPRIEHFGLPTEDHLKRAAYHEFRVVTQPIFLKEIGGNFRAYLDDDYLERCYPIRSMMRAGIATAFSTDAPVVRDLNPFAGIAAAFHREDHTGHPIAMEESVSVYDSLRAYTIAGAIASGDEGNRGTLEAGKWGDFIVLDSNPLDDDTDLMSIKVLETWVSGKPIWKAE